MRIPTSLFLFFLLLNSGAVFAQTKADSINLIFPKAVIINNKKQVLLSFDNNRKAYELPSIGFLEGPISFDQYVRRTAEELNVIIATWRLGGMFTYIYPNKYRTVIRPYFVMYYKGNPDPGNFKDTTSKWFSYEAAVKAIPYPASARALQRVLSDPKAVWSATFEEYGYTNPVDTSKITFRVIEDFYKMNEP